MLRQIRMTTTKRTYHQEWSFGSNYFFFEILFQIKNLLKSVNLMYQRQKYPYSYFSEAPEFNFRALFSVSWQFPDGQFPPMDTSPTDISPTRHFADEHFPDGHFPDGHFTDGHFPDGHFPDQTHPWRTLPRPYFLIVIFIYELILLALISMLAKSSYL